MYEEIDPYELAQAVREIAAERPDHVYVRPGTASNFYSAKCYYTTEEGSPDCIVGHAMARIGKPMPAQSHDDEDHPSCPLLNHGVGDGAWLRALGVVDEYYGNYKMIDVVRWLHRVQREQDDKASWGDAVATADLRYPGATVRS